jgi:hypothetical protein
MYYVVHKFPNLSRASIHLGTYAHLIEDNKCKKSLEEIKNMLVNEVYRTPIATTSTIVLFMSKPFFYLSSEREFDVDSSPSTPSIAKIIKFFSMTCVIHYSLIF